jgi:hypothetical protein
MIKTWKLAALASIAALGLLALLPGGGARPDIASAALDDCGSSGVNLEVTINEDGDLISQAGTTLTFDPSPIDEDEDSFVVVDNGAEDDDATVGEIEVEDICTSSDGSDEFDIEIAAPALLNCDEDLLEDNDVSAPTSAAPADLVLEYEFEDCVLAPTPTGTATVTGTPTVPSAVTLVATPTSVGCQGSSFVTVTVKTATGANVANGTNVTLATNFGTITPASAQTFGGSVLGVFTAPAGQSGTATITATAGGVNGTTTIAVNCGNPTATAVPTQTGGGITPPDTGDGGISSDSGSSWNLLGYGFIAVAALLGASGVAWSRRSR